MPEVGHGATLKDQSVLVHPRLAASYPGLSPRIFHWLEISSTLPNRIPQTSPVCQSRWPRSEIFGQLMAVANSILGGDQPGMGYAVVCQLEGLMPPVNPLHALTEISCGLGNCERLHGLESYGEVYSRSSRQARAMANPISHRRVACPAVPSIFVEFPQRFP